MFVRLVRCYSIVVVDISSKEVVALFSPVDDDSQRILEETKIVKSLGRLNARRF